MPLSWKEHDLFRGIAVSSCMVLAYMANTMGDEDKVGTAGRRRAGFLRVAIVDHVVMVIMQFLERA